MKTKIIIIALLFIFTITEGVSVALGQGVGIGTLTPTATFDVRSNGTGPMSYTMKTYNSLNNPIFSITDTGQLGLGTFNPASTVHFKDATSSYLPINPPTILIESDFPGIYFQNASAGAAGNNTIEVDPVTSDLKITYNLLHDVIFESRSTGVGTGGQHMIIKGGNGNVGIATATPVQKLDVNGNAHVSGNLGVGINYPAYKLDVNGIANVNGFRMSTGASAGYVLVSDAGGTASWVDPATLSTPSDSDWVKSGNVVCNLNDSIGIGTSTPLTKLHVNDGTVRFSGYQGDIPGNGAGRAMMWIPAFAAFRAGEATGTQWDSSSTGLFSTAFGVNGISSGYAAFAAGENAEATGDNAAAFGYHCDADGTGSFAGGYLNDATGNYSTAIGFWNDATGTASVALGRLNEATSTDAICLGRLNEASANGSIAIGDGAVSSGSGSIAIGESIEITGSGSMILGGSGPPGVPTTFTKSGNSTFYTRYRNGYYLYSNYAATVGVQLAAGGNSWSSISDSTKKENFQILDGEDVLNKISNITPRSWNYIGQSPKTHRHYGPMAQEFFAAFGQDDYGTIGNDTTIAAADFQGINFTAIHALEKRTRQLQEKTVQLENLQDQYNSLEARTESLETRLAELEILLNGMNTNR